MATVDKNIADQIVAGKFKSDNPVKIVKYTNAWGGESYGLICRGQPLDLYRETEFVRSPSTYWTKEGGLAK
jgi:hypothetical protein